MKQPLHILIVEDSEDDARFIMRELQRGGYEPREKRVETEKTFRAALADGPWDVIIADYNLPQFGAIEALRLLKESGLDLPFLIVSGVIGEEVAVKAMKSGAHDYILKHSLARLSPAVARELRDAQTRHERLRAREELETSREQLRALAAHLQSVREDERKFITREIHDELGQSLTGFKMDLAWMRNRMQSEEWAQIKQPILEKIRAMGELLDGTANLVRKLCTELRPGVLDDLGLTAAIEWQAREYQKRTGIICEASVELGELTVDPERSTALFRIFQEILTNVARHAQARRVDAVLKLAGEELLLEVRDDGRGIKPGEIAGAKSLGLLGMRERALVLGGTVSITGKTGAGTTVTVTMPQKNPEPEKIGAAPNLAAAN
jgi:signal transduction histidine kinase